MLLTLIVVVALLLVIGAVMYNGLVSLRRQTQTAFGQIELQLKRRCEAIPNLIEVIKKELPGEQATLEKLSQARAQALDARTVAGKALAANQVQRAIAAVFALMAAHPELAVDDDMISLQEAFRSTQNKIVFAGQYYNDVATKYNLRIETFPSSLFASMGRFAPIDLFETEPATVHQPAPLILTDSRPGY